MGGDHGSAVVIDGVQQALKAYSQISELFLVGQQREIEQAIRSVACNDSRVRIVPATEIITMDDKPLDVVRRKKDCSMVRAMELVRDGKAEAVISPGNTGALVASATLKLRRLEGVERPAIACIMPAGAAGEVLLLDAGANPDCKPLHLAQFAVMGSVYSRGLLQQAKPRVGILNIGSEEMKGDSVVQDAAKLVSASKLNYVGFVEGDDIFSGDVDVVVTDGFTGNVALKTMEGLANMLVGALKTEYTRNPLRYVGAAASWPVLRSLRREFDPRTYNGASMVGLTGIVIKSHGSADVLSFRNAIRVGLIEARKGVPMQIANLLTAQLA